jgi:hypothetical protein
MIVNYAAPGQRSLLFYTAPTCFSPFKNVFSHWVLILCYLFLRIDNHYYEIEFDPGKWGRQDQDRGHPQIEYLNAPGSWVEKRWVWNTYALQP